MSLIKNLSLLILISICSCQTPGYKKTYTVDPELNQVCRIDAKYSLDGVKLQKTQKKNCISLDAKDPKTGTYVFDANQGYLVISIESFKNLLLKALDEVKQ